MTWNTLLPIVAVAGVAAFVLTMAVVLWWKYRRMNAQTVDPLYQQPRRQTIYNSPRQPLTTEADEPPLRKRQR